MLPLFNRFLIMCLTSIIWLGVYFFVNRLKVDPARRIDLGLPVDRRLPFIPEFAFIYFSTFPFGIQPFLILEIPGQFYWMFATFLAITVVATFVHATLPSKIERMPEKQIGGPFGGFLTLFQRTCNPYGNFPSMHVGLSVPVVISNYLAFGPLVGSLVLVWAVLIALSTLFTKQHYILDVLAGALGGLLISALTWWVMM